jgi:signal transduction histidine kinase
VKLLDQILDVARTEHGTNDLEIQPLQLAWVLAEVYKLTHLLAADCNFPLHVSPPAVEIYVLADPAGCGRS